MAGVNHFYDIVLNSTNIISSATCFKPNPNNIGVENSRLKLPLPQMNTAYLSLGSNIGNRQKWLQQAINQIGIKCGTILKTSAIYETAAWGINAQPAFLNMVLALQTTLSPTELLNEILAIEISLGRKREIKWGARTIDIDILFYDQTILELPSLIIPHPYLQERRFTLVPMAEIAPKFNHPILNQTITQLLEICPDTLEVIKI